MPACRQYYVKFRKRGERLCRDEGAHPGPSTLFNEHEFGLLGGWSCLHRRFDEWIAQLLGAGATSGEKVYAYGACGRDEDVRLPWIMIRYEPYLPLNRTSLADLRSRTRSGPTLMSAVVYRRGIRAYAAHGQGHPVRLYLYLSWNQ